MDVSLLQICAAPAEGWTALGQRIDESARRGYSYEFEDCLLPPGCTPQRTRVGFSRQRDGTYLLYFRPAVDYIGSTGPLAALFRRPVWRFSSFETLQRQMASLSWAMAPPSPAGPWPVLYAPLAQALGRQVLGQPRAVAAAAFRLSAHLGKCAPLRPLSLVLHGPTGVGKSELGKALPEALEGCCGRSYHFVWVDMNSYAQSHSVQRLTGAPPGYVGYEDASPLEAVRERPYTVFMLDEMEKAHPEVLKAFMPILDEGRCTARRADDKGQRELDFRRCIFVFTTNLPLHRPADRPLGFAPERQGPSSEERRSAATPEALSEQLYQDNETARQALMGRGVLPEIAGRFGAFIAFSPLDAAAQEAILQKQIAALGREYGLSEICTDPETVRAILAGRGALSPRSLVTVLEGMLCPLFSQAVAEGLRRLYLTGTPGRLRLASHPGTAGSNSTVPLAASIS